MKLFSGRCCMAMSCCGVHLLAWLMHIIRDRYAVCDGDAQADGLFAIIIRQQRAPTWRTAMFPKEGWPACSAELQQNVFALAAVAPRQVFCYRAAC